MKVSVEDGMPRCNSPGLLTDRYPTMDVTPGAIRGGAAVKSETRFPSAMTSTLAVLPTINLAM